MTPQQIKERIDSISAGWYLPGGTISVGGYPVTSLKPMDDRAEIAIIQLLDDVLAGLEFGDIQGSDNEAYTSGFNNAVSEMNYEIKSLRDGLRGGSDVEK